ncbi:hypothetical protein MXMO3_01818 [Maritalea myrionectae]|uniref:Uncharacterized protein n=1 Tax=Maritalea myrionectae TaxID=454601 RepID=A0A2R4MED7_9HYPH|nr:hypothetical protein MXMO3_01818 [Maritalea myrionectae]
MMANFEVLTFNEHSQKWEPVEHEGFSIEGTVEAKFTGTIKSDQVDWVAWWKFWAEAQ